MFDVLKLREASESRFRRQCRGPGAPNLDFDDSVEDGERESEGPQVIKYPNTAAPTYVDMNICVCVYV